MAVGPNSIEKCPSDIIFMSHRRERVNSVLRQQISQIIESELNDPRIAYLVSVTSADVSPDLRLAKIHVSVVGDKCTKDDTLKVLNKAANHIQKRIRRKLTLRSVPICRFYLDESIERGSEMLKIIDEIIPGSEITKAI